MNEKLGLRIADRGLRNEDNETTAGSATPPYLRSASGTPRRGVRGLLQVAWASSPCLKFIPFFLCALLSFCVMSTVTQAENEESEALSVPEALPLEAYTFSMQLTPGTDCTVKINENERAGKKPLSLAPNQLHIRKNPVEINRLFRKEISLVREVYSDGSDSVFYFFHGLCAFDDPRKGINIRHQTEGEKYSVLDTYHFPELLWAGPETQKPNKGDPSIYLYQAAEWSLEVDSISKRPIRFHKGKQEWTYSYKESANPISVPEKLSQALLQAIGESDAENAEPSNKSEPTNE